MLESCPYVAQPRHAKWRASVGAVARGAVDPTVPSPIRIDHDTRIVTAGSCFAQHVRAHVVRRGYRYHFTEPIPDTLSDEEAEERGYGMFSARYGNVYTTPQLLQLYQHAFGLQEPEEKYWMDGDRFIDPFRPFIEPEGFASLAALRDARAALFAGTRRAFEEAELFIFTLGLTETWRNRRDGSYYPVCPGCGVASFDAARYEFVNLDVEQTVDALAAFLAALASVNPGVRVVLTVSPVPLLATMTDRHVVEATVYSKSVLRVAAETVRRAMPFVEYFPAYEIVTATHRDHVYFAGDGRTVTPLGVNRVMDLFFQTYAGEAAPAIPALDHAPNAASSVVCDEETALALLDAPNQA